MENEVLDQKFCKKHFPGTNNKNVLGVLSLRMVRVALCVDTTANFIRLLDAKKIYILFFFLFLLEKSTITIIIYIQNGKLLK